MILARYLLEFYLEKLVRANVHRPSDGKNSAYGRVNPPRFNTCNRCAYNARFKRELLLRIRKALHVERQQQRHTRRDRLEVHGLLCPLRERLKVNRNAKRKAQDFILGFLISAHHRKYILCPKYRVQSLVRIFVNEVRLVTDSGSNIAVPV